MAPLSKDWKFYLPVLQRDFPFCKWTTLDEKWDEEMPYIMWYFFSPKRNLSVATGESARRYFSYLSSLPFGIPNVLFPGIIQPDLRYLSFFSFPFLRFSNMPLTDTIKKYWDYEAFSIRTSYRKNEPRLLLVAVDVQSPSSPVVFDSNEYVGKGCLVCGIQFSDPTKLKAHVYHSYFNLEPIGIVSDDLRWTVYGDEREKYVITHDGISLEHLVASMSTHFMHKYQSIKVRQVELDSVMNEVRTKKEAQRYFWDGAYLSNTPLRELLGAHKDYWYNQKQSAVVPNLEIYVINLFPSLETELPDDPHSILDREMDIQFYDRTRVDIVNALDIGDYASLIQESKNIGMRHAHAIADFENDFDRMLNYRGKSLDRFGTGKKYRELVEGSFEIQKIVYIDRKDDKDSTFAKVAEFSAPTIEGLINAGYHDASLVLRIQAIIELLGATVNSGILSLESNSLMQKTLRSIVADVKHEKFDSARNELSQLMNLANQIIDRQEQEVISALTHEGVLVDIELARARILLSQNLEKITLNQSRDLEGMLECIEKDFVRAETRYTYNNVSSLIGKVLRVATPD